MRQIGILDSEALAVVFIDYVTVRGLDVRADFEDGHWAIWCRNEDQLDKVREQFEHFLANPEAPEYREVAAEAGRIRKQQQRQREEIDRRIVQMSQRWQRPVYRQAPLTMILIAVSVGVWIAAGFPNSRSHLYNRLVFYQPSVTDVDIPDTDELKIDRTDGLDQVKQGQVWRLISPIFVHFGPFHLFFNMYWLFLFGTLIESRRGTLRFALMVIVIGVFSNLGEYYGSGVYAGGMSGVGFGLFGYLWMKTLYEPESNMSLAPGTALMFSIWFLLCVTGFVGNIANWAHGVGLAAGILIGRWKWLWETITRKNG